MRLARDLSVDQAAAACDIPAVTWRTWEKGAKPRDMAGVIQAIQDTMGVDRDWLMWGKTPDDSGAAMPAPQGGDTSADLPSSPSRCIAPSEAFEVAA